MIIDLPYPPSANRYWRIFRNRAVPSKDATAYKRAVRSRCCSLRPVGGKIAVSVTLRPKLTKAGKASKVIIDLDNCLKVALDALQGIAYHNDAQVVEIFARYGEPVEAGGLTIEVRSIEP